MGAVTTGALALLGGTEGMVFGAVGGVTVSYVLKRVGADVQQRWLGPRQRVRVGAAFATAVGEISRRLDDRPGAAR